MHMSCEGYPLGRCPRGPEDVADPLALELQVVLSHLIVGARN